MPNYAVIDLGSNSVRLVVFEVRNDKKRSYSYKDFRHLINNKSMAGLAAYVEDGVFTEAGVKRAASVLKGHLKRSKYFQCKRIDCFATAVLRNASNCDDAIAAIEEETGLPITLLSARDEAHLGFVGATCDRAIERGTLIDIGGGSTELTRIENGKESDGVSLGMGSLSSYARFVKDILPTPEEALEIRAAFWELIEALPDREAFRAERFYGIGGTVRGRQDVRADPRRGRPPQDAHPRAGGRHPPHAPQRRLGLRAQRPQGVGGTHPHAHAGLRDPGVAAHRPGCREARDLQVRRARGLPHRAHAGIARRDRGRSFCHVIQT